MSHVYLPGPSRSKTHELTEPTVSRLWVLGGLYHVSAVFRLLISISMHVDDTFKSNKCLIRSFNLSILNSLCSPQIVLASAYNNPRKQTGILGLNTAARRFHAKCANELLFFTVVYNQFFGQ